MKKQHCGFEGVYDLFAIRIIIDCPIEKEKMQCWQVYSIITDMYQPNPKRLRDWLSVPKSNGYESLHITVLGPEKKWVEVQIRTERMDEIAERGLAAHWRYKGVKGGEGGLDDWLNSIRSALEAGDDLQVMDTFKMDLYEDEVFVFTPKGDLLKFPKGATVLDFAYHIHSKVGNQCTGARINNKVVTFRQELHSGDQVEIITSTTQKPKQDWLNIVKTSKKKKKIRLALKETQVKDGLYAKETLQRRLKNRKIEMDESTMNHVIKKLGFKLTSEFYKQLAEGSLDINSVIEKYIEIRGQEQNPVSQQPMRSANEFEFENPNEEIMRNNDDISWLNVVTLYMAMTCLVLLRLVEVLRFIVLIAPTRQNYVNVLDIVWLKQNGVVRVLRSTLLHFMWLGMMILPSSTISQASLQRKKRL